MKIQELDSLLYPCGHCGCLVVATSLRLLEYSAPRQDDPDEVVRVSSLHCQDPVACEARRWSNQAARSEERDDIPLDELVEGEPLFRCMACDAVRTLDAIVVEVVSDDEGVFPEISCENSEECSLYQSSAEWRAIQEMTRKRCAEEEGEE